MRPLFFFLHTITYVFSSACDNHKCVIVNFDNDSEIPGFCEEDSSQDAGYRCKCEDLGGTPSSWLFYECYVMNANLDGILLDTEPTTTTVSAEPASTFESTVSPSLQPPEEITTEEETTTVKSRPSITATKTDPVTTTIRTTTEEEEKKLIFGMERIMFLILIGCCGFFVIIIAFVSIIYCRCPSKKKDTPARNDTQRNVLLPDIDEEENFPLANSNRAETNWKNSQDSFENSEDESFDQNSPTEAIKLCKYVTQTSATQSQNGGSRPISCSMQSISSTRPSVKPPAPPVPNPSALLSAPPDFPPPPPPPAPEKSGSMIANPKYPYHVPFANQQKQ